MHSIERVPPYWDITKSPIGWSTALSRIGRSFEIGRSKTSVHYTALYSPPHCTMETSAGVSSVMSDTDPSSTEPEIWTLRDESVMKNKRDLRPALSCTTQLYLYFCFRGGKHPRHSGHDLSGMPLCTTLYQGAHSVSGVSSANVARLRGPCELDPTTATHHGRKQSSSTKTIGTKDSVPTAAAESFFLVLTLPTTLGARCAPTDGSAKPSGFRQSS